MDWLDHELSAVARCAAQQLLCSCELRGVQLQAM